MAEVQEQPQAAQLDDGHGLSGQDSLLDKSESSQAPPDESTTYNQTQNQHQQPQELHQQQPHPEADAEAQTRRAKEEDTINSATSTRSTSITTTVVTETASTNGIPAGQLQQDGSAPLSPSTAAMSNPPHHPGQSRPQPPYPNPAYQMNATYAYANPAAQSADPYRASPTTTTNPMSLPSMRTFDPMQHQQQQPQQPMPIAAQIPQVPGNMAYYPTPVPLAGHPYVLPPDAMGHRYAIPTDPRAMLAGGRNSKKEIKRRTKTGCLTCRKRRIKCDETHPICKNCQKSKRECLGYDPIFKQQQQPTNIQPATNSPHPAPPASVPSNGPPIPTSVPSNAVAYTSLPSALPTAADQNIKAEHFEYATAIDPALDSVGPTSGASTSHFPAMKPLDQNILEAPHLRGGGPSFPPLHHSASPNAQRTPAYFGSSVRKMRVDELVAWGVAGLPKLEMPPSEETLVEIRSLYNEIYSQGLEKFVESKWYIREPSVGMLLVNQAITNVFAGFLNIVRTAGPNDNAAMNYSANLEFRVVWELLRLPYTADGRVNTGSVLPGDDDQIEASNRTVVLETLLAGEYLDQNPLLPPPLQGDYHRLREYDFWHSLAEFLRIKNQVGIDMTPARDQILGRMRGLLDGRENRDVLYSIAVIRAFAPMFPPDFESTLSPHLDETDPKNRLAVAQKFIQDESKITGGTTNVVRRFSELAARAFIAPGGNISRQ